MLSACSNTIAKKSENDNISYVERQLYIGETDNYFLEVITGESEKPFIADGIANNRSPFVSFRLRSKTATITSCTFKFNDITANGIEYNHSINAQVFQNVSINDGDQVTVLVNEKEVKFNLINALEGAAEVNVLIKTALSSLGIEDCEHYASITKDKFSLGVYYYFVAAVNKEGFKSVLLNFQTGEIIASSKEP